MQLQATYPTPEHQTAANVIVDYFVSNYKIDAVLLANSCARGKATRDSCLDIVVLAKPDQSRSSLRVMESDWEAFEKSNQAIQALYQVGKYSVVHPGFTDGVFVPIERDEAAGPDDFEVEVGNFLAYSVPLWQGSDYLAELRQQWLPFTTMSCVNKDLKWLGGIVSTICITFHFMLNAVCIFNLLTGYTMPIVNFFKLCLSHAGLIRSLTINGFVKKWKKS